MVVIAYSFRYSVLFLISLPRNHYDRYNIVMFFFPFQFKSHYLFCMSKLPCVYLLFYFCSVLTNKHYRYNISELYIYSILLSLNLIYIHACLLVLYIYIFLFPENQVTCLFKKKKISWPFSVLFHYIPVTQVFIHHIYIIISLKIPLHLF